MSRTLTLLACLLTLAAALAGCGTDEQAERDAAAAAAAAQERKEQAAEAREAVADAERQAEDAAAAHRACRAEMGELSDQAVELGSRLDVGLNYDDYSDKVADLKVAYDQVGPGGDTDLLDCLTTVGLPLEKALNHYMAAYRTWDECFDDWSCDNDSITPELQGRWAKAQTQVDRAARALDDMATAVDDAQDELADAKAALDDLDDRAPAASGGNSS